MSILTVVAPNGKSEPHALSGRRFSLGRASDNDLPVESSFVSRYHALLLPVESGYAIQDLESKNGTWVNGVRLGKEPLLLNDGDAIVLGNKRVAFRFYVEEESTITVTASDVTYELEVDPAGREVAVRGQRLVPPLSRKEFDILALLWERRSTACSRDELAARGWPERAEGEVSNEEIEQYIRRLRRRLGDNGRAPRLILTLRGYGYKMP